MESESQDPNTPPNLGTERTEPVRSRWTPKPEQILILESIFNSGMVNPPKDETVRIRKLLEKFGSVGDANVFYWFQNRRSRSRRRQRQIQASLAGEQQAQATAGGGGGGGAIQYQSGFMVNSPCLGLSPSSCYVGSSSSSSSSSSSCGLVENGSGVDDLFCFSGQMGIPEIEQNSSMVSILGGSDASNLQYQSGGFITVFINGIATDVPRGTIDIKSMFGEEVMLVHSSGMAVPFNEYGISLHSLQHGESYFLVSRPN
ncbi:WUSCHEL-related homeobox 12 [Camellia lanceoleosa]|uniref:WUSCHEL-related homeobox 12 n=1 Tax=Camellia lanceoleosa TaxID=1840588 RepID=A0ACC0FNS1_9ERIC|nr:WUSCHEL-related homeobox 12 [Camellia lanceoleosa]